MMHSNGFVVAIRDNNGQVLRESRDREVFLPFHSNYSIRLKNNNNRRAVAKISIDGTDILGSRKIILEPHSSEDLERFCLDGDLSHGRKLEFVPLNDGRVQDPSSGENGIIHIKFTLEQQKPQKVYVDRPVIIDPKPWKPYIPWQPYDPWSPGPWTCDSPLDVSGGMTHESSAGFCSSPKIGSSMDNYSAEVNYHTDSICTLRDTGATVEGGNSNQSFSTGSFLNSEAHSTVITLRLRPAEKTITVQTTKKIHCSQCGTKCRRRDKFCRDCGKRL